MNIEDFAELQAFAPPPYTSLNEACAATSTNPNSPKPCDHVVFNPGCTGEIDDACGFGVIRLVDTMAATWSGPEAYPRKPYNANLFCQIYSDHSPVSFRGALQAADDD
jgi:hypothetical protein